MYNYKYAAIQSMSTVDIARHYVLCTRA